MNAVLTLIRFATENIEARPATQQAEIYEAIAATLPDPQLALEAERVAFAIRETNKLQLDFTQMLPATPMTPTTTTTADTH